MNENGIHILMTGAGAPGAAGIIHCLQALPAVRLTVADANPFPAGRYLAGDFVQVPRADSPGFVDTLLAACREKDIHVVLPLVTRELIPLAGRKEEFELAGATVLVSPASSLEIANDKGRLYQFLQWRGLAVPDFRIVETVEQFQTAAKELGYPGKPICFKPCRSNGSRGFRVIDASVNESRILFGEKPGSPFLPFAESIRILSSEPFPELLVSEWLEGEEFSVDCLAKEGKAILVVPRKRTKVIQGITVQGEFVNDPDIIRFCSEVIRELKLNGNIGIQLIKLKDGTPGILEINPRVQGTISAALGAGINLPVLAVKQALHLPIGADEMEVKWGVRFARYWSEVFY